jgi:ADP-dependent NAD(P)H-hydrate dehydratase / NAD(P)H-hydrate epimerase
MIKILNTKQVKELDAYTITNEPVASIDLMERASRAFVEWFVQKFDATKKVGVICGTGNNGGDGLAIARLLQDWRYPVKVWVVKGNAAETVDFKINLSRLNGKIVVDEIVNESDKGLFTDRDILIDAIFGSGLSRPTEGIHAQAIRCINASEAIKISVDIPSGLSADSPSSGDIVQADYTITFQFPKLSFFFPQSFRYTGEWISVDIGLSKEFIRKAETQHFVLTTKAIRRLIKPRLKFDHKGSYGHALLVAGSFGKMGAAVLAAKAVLRSGVGLLTVRVPKCGYLIIQGAVPEAMASVDTAEELITEVPDPEKYSTIGVGPGLGTDQKSVEAIKNLVKIFRKPIVFDADALNIFAANEELLQSIPKGSILTPHPKEFERLVGAWENDFQRLEKQKDLAARIKSVVILKGAYTSIATPGGVIYFNSTGNQGMATGGTGDVLTGILTGLLAQNYSPEQAAVIGVFVHGLSGDFAKQEKGMISLISSDLVDYLPQAFLKVVTNK